MDKYEEADELIDKIMSSVIEDLYGEFDPGADEFIEVKDATISGRIQSDRRIQAVYRVMRGNAKQIETEP